jgi:hypothetical protein
VLLKIDNTRTIRLIGRRMCEPKNLFLELVHFFGFTYHGPKVEFFYILNQPKKYPIRGFLVEKHIGDVIFV